MGSKLLCHFHFFAFIFFKTVPNGPFPVPTARGINHEIPELLLSWTQYSNPNPENLILPYYYSIKHQWGTVL